MYKVQKGLAPIFMSNIFAENHNMHAQNVSARTRSQSTFYCSGIPKTTKFGIETLRYLGPKIWNMVPDNIKSAGSITIFKSKLKKWEPIGCPCRLCATFISGLGLL